MPFSHRPFRRFSPARGGAFVLAVGRRVYMARSEGGPARVTLTDDTGANELSTLKDGNEVEIIAWRPGGSGTRYQVRSTGEGREGWVAVANLRRTRLAAAPAPAAAVPSVAPSARPRARQSANSGGRVEQRAH